jgi:predicted O-methyltransferase YrrM
MDEKVEAVLTAYERRIEQERTLAPQDLAPDAPDPRMRAVGPATGRFLHLLARSLRAPTILEVGTSYGYSGIWLGDAARASGGRVITMELHDYKAAFARDMANQAGLAAYIDFRVGDALGLIADLETSVNLVLMDLWKDLYLPCLQALLPKLAPGAIIVADNARPENEAIRRYGRAVRAIPGMTSVWLPVGSWLEVSRYEPGGSIYADPDARATTDRPDRPGR